MHATWRLILFLVLGHHLTGRMHSIVELTCFSFLHSFLVKQPTRYTIIFLLQIVHFQGADRGTGCSPKLEIASWRSILSEKLLIPGFLVVHIHCIRGCAIDCIFSNNLYTSHFQEDKGNLCTLVNLYTYNVNYSYTINKRVIWVLLWLMMVTVEPDEVEGPCISQRKTAAKPLALSNCSSQATKILTALLRLPLCIHIYPGGIDVSIVVIFVFPLASPLLTSTACGSPGVPCPGLLPSRHKGGIKNLFGTCMCMYNWASVSKPHTSALNINFCLYGTVVRTSMSRPVAQLVTHMPLLPPRTPFVLPHSITSSETIMLEWHWQR